MWLIIRYQPTALFSLRYSAATSTGAKSLLVPSPYTVKMALLVAAIRWQGVAYAEENFPFLRDLRPVRLRPPQYAIANRCFLKYQKPREDKVAKSKRTDDYEAPIGYQSTVGFREYIYLQGLLEIALPIQNEAESQFLLELAVRVNYFGKRGSFMQFTAYEIAETLPAPFSTGIGNPEANTGGMLQPFDDMAPGLTFEQVDITSDARMGTPDRPSTPTLLPYRIVRSAVGYAFYVRNS